jgi:hypothetical protein
MRITEEIATKCDVLDLIIEEFLAAKNALDGSYRVYEAPFEALNLFNLTIRHVEGVIALARRDLVMLPPAELAARAALESAVGAAWTMDPADLFERESRWLAHLKTEEDTLSRAIRLGTSHGIDMADWQKQLSSIKSFREAVASLLEARGYSANIAVPHLRDCLRSLGEERLYFAYMKFSQIAHATHPGTGLYRSGLGTKKIQGEFVNADDWNFPVDICVFAFKIPGLRILRQLGADVARLAEIFDHVIVPRTSKEHE